MALHFPPDNPDQHPPLMIDAETVDGGVRIAIGGDIDISSADELAEALAPDEVVEIDLSDVEFIDSQGLRVLIESHYAHAAMAQTIVSASPQVRRVLSVTGLASTLAPDLDL